MADRRAHPARRGPFYVNLLLIAIAGSDGSQAISNQLAISNLQFHHASLIP
jgi:hypothetical protein